MKTYIKIYEDAQGNELKRREEKDINIKFVRLDAKYEQANSMMSDLKRIRVIKKH
jgi:hypothetical protein